MRLKRPLRGGERGRDVRAIQRALNRWARPRVALPENGRFDLRTSDRLLSFQAAEGLSPADGKVDDQRTLDELTKFMDARARWYYRTFRVPRGIPDLGPVVSGGKSVLDHDLTHPTGGLPGYPAFDEGWGAGKPFIAPEPVIVWRNSTNRRRDGRTNGRSIYARGASGIQWYFGHLERPAIPTSRRAVLTRGRLGTPLAKGSRLGVISGNHEEPHGHVGVDAKAVIGRELEHRDNYQHGGPTIRQQLERALL